MKTSDLFLYVVVAIVLMALLKVLTRKARKSTTKVASSFTAKRVLSAPEAILYHRLCEAAPSAIVLTQVSLHRILAVATGGQAAFNSIAQKAVDFVVCRPDFSVVCVIELDDSSHDSRRDNARDGILNSARIETVRFNVKNLPSVSQICMQLDSGQAWRPSHQKSERGVSAQKRSVTRDRSTPHR